LGATVVVVTGRADHQYWDHGGLAKLIAGFLLAPLAWLLDLQVSYATVKWACAADQRMVLFLLPLGSFAVIGFATWLSWSCWTRLRKGGALEGAHVRDRSYFLAVAGLAMNALFGLLIITSYAPRALLSPCE
jgi:hypothetical protein